jgi:hypothetical protein
MWWLAVKGPLMTAWLLVAPSPSYCTCILNDLPRSMDKSPTLEHRCEYVFDADAEYPSFPSPSECDGANPVLLDDSRNNTRFLR